MKTSNNNNFAQQVETLHYTVYVEMIKAEKRAARKEDWREVIAAASATIDATIRTAIVAVQQLKVAIPVAIILTGLIFAVKYL